MSYGHAHSLARRLAPDSEPAGPSVNPMLWGREDMRAALRARDIGTVYRLILEETGISQHRLAKLVGQTQSEVSEILKGRRVKDIAVLERIVTRLGIPPELIGLSAYGPAGTYCGEVTVADPPEGASAKMLRRQVLALRRHTTSSIVLATIHVRAGEPGALALAHSAITGVTKLSSAQARRRLEPLVAALEARPGADAKELDRLGQQVAATRA